MVTIESESFNRALFDELVPLGQKCWDENTIAKAETCAFYGERDFYIDPDFDTYQRLAVLGVLVIVTVRDEGRLVGFMAGFTHSSLHHKKILCAIADSIYLEPEFRSHTPIVAARFETEMTSRGVQIISCPTHEGGPVHEFLKAMGYVGDDIVMEKRLCVS